MIITRISLSFVGNETNMAATDEEDEVLYENLNKKNSYDEITMNFGRPVIQIPDPKEDDIFASISFSSPIEDLKPMTPPIPAPRLSKQKSSKQILPENEDQEVILKTLIFLVKSKLELAKQYRNIIF